MKLYTVRVACEVAGRWRTPDVPFPLSEVQARHLAPPLGSVIIPYQEVDHGRQHRHKRKDRRAAQ